MNFTSVVKNVETGGIHYIGFAEDARIEADILNTEYQTDAFRVEPYNPERK